MGKPLWLEYVQFMLFGIAPPAVAVTAICLVWHWDVSFPGFFALQMLGTVVWLVALYTIGRLTARK
jgi:hypothetical protein